MEIFLSQFLNYQHNGSGRNRAHLDELPYINGLWRSLMPKNPPYFFGYIFSSFGQGVIVINGFVGEPKPKISHICGVQNV